MTTQAPTRKSPLGRALAAATLVTTAGITVLAAGLFLAAFALPATVHAAAAAPAAPSAAGAALYKEKCQGCHAADGSGTTPVGKALKVQDMRQPATQAKSDAELAAAITAGKGKMPAQKGLTAAQVTQLVSYLRTLAPAK